MKYIGYSVIIVVVVACIGVPIFYTWYGVSINETQQYGIPELVYYSSQIVGSFATLAAVVYALFGESFRNYIYREKCDV